MKKLLLVLGGIAVLAGAVFILAGGGDMWLFGRSAASAQVITPGQYQEQFAGTKHFLLDVRTPEEFASGHIQGAVNISVQTLSARLNEVPKDQPVVVYCRSATAASLLRRAGYTDVYDLGGIIAWTQAGYALRR